ncbi:G:T-mismatch repair DNA endonuclease (very short patch repair protein) [Nakamurella flavida]|nr:G:T-mismatch repair DNA endonuclease (very short patch repair protein) [Nakamurella flavida]
MAVFVDGCFWHGCPEHHTVSATHARFWADKITRNRERARETNAILQEAGWIVMRFWEHQDPTLAARAVAVQMTSLHRDATAAATESYRSTSPPHRPPRPPERDPHG